MIDPALRAVEEESHSLYAYLKMRKVALYFIFNIIDLSERENVFIFKC